MEIIVFACICIPVLDWQKSYLTNTHIWISDRSCAHEKILCYMKDFAVNVIKVQNISWIMTLYKLYSEMIKIISVLVYLLYIKKLIYSCN